MILLTTHIDTSVNPLDKGDLWKSILVYQPFPYRLLFICLFIGGTGHQQFKIISQSQEQTWLRYRTRSHRAWQLWSWLKWFTQRISANPGAGERSTYWNEGQQKALQEGSVTLKPGVTGACPVLHSPLPLRMLAVPSQANTLSSRTCWALELIRACACVCVSVYVLDRCL